MEGNIWAGEHLRVVSMIPSRGEPRFGTPFLTEAKIQTKTQQTLSCRFDRGRNIEAVPLGWH